MKIFKPTLWLVVCAAAAVLTVVSCTGGKNQPAAEVDDTPEGLKLRYDVTQADTLRIYELTDRFFSLLQSGDVEGATAMLLQQNGFNRMEPLPNVPQVTAALSLFSGFSSYDVSQFVLHKENDNLMKVSVTLFEPDGDDDTRPNKTNLVLRPVRVDGQWYLTLSDTNNDTYANHISEIPVK